MAIVATLITPLVLATTPATIDVKVPTYNHLTQGAEVVQVAAGTSRQTSMGTQTFDVNGRPRDSDHDTQND